MPPSKPHDQVADEIHAELLKFRQGAGVPTAGRLTGLSYLVQILGEGAPLRAFEEFTRLYESLGQDPLTPVGAFFYLSGWGVGKDTIKRRQIELELRGVSLSTSRRWADEGAHELVTIIRDRDETNRPWAFISIFQERNRWHPFLDFNLGTESWLPPTVSINGAVADVDFTFRHDHEGGRWLNRTILPEQDLDLDVQFTETMGTLRVEWPMPVWPIWQLAAWVADPRIQTRMRTFRQRAVEVSLTWWNEEMPSRASGLAGSDGVWVVRLRPETETASEIEHHADGRPAISGPGSSRDAAQIRSRTRDAP